MMSAFKSSNMTSEWTRKYVGASLEFGILGSWDQFPAGAEGGLDVVTGWDPSAPALTQQLSFWSKR